MADQENTTETSIPSLKDFQLLEILSNDAARKKLVILGKFNEAGDNNKAIIFVEKKEFAADNFTTDDDEKAFLKHLTLKTTLVNSIYADFVGLIDSKFNELKVTTIYPATEAHVTKYSMQNFLLIKETPEMYQEVILPHLERQQFSIDWIYNILEGKKEADRVEFADTDPTHGFLFVKDYKWNNQVESLHITALAMARGIKSIRDLNASHLPLLESIQKNCLATINSKYGLDEHQVRAYLHYQPSYYHLHVHFTNLKFDAPGIFADRAHLLTTVIGNIKLMPDYYQKATLTFAVGEKSELYKSIKAAENPQPSQPE